MEIEMRKYTSGSARAIALAFIAIIFFAGFAAAATVEFLDCPSCNNNPILKIFCTKCGGDGKVTILQYIVG